MTLGASTLGDLLGKWLHDQPDAGTIVSPRLQESRTFAAAGALRYRIFYLSPGGRVAGCDEFAADSDEEAKAFAETLREGRPAELWQRARRISWFDGAWPDSLSSSAH